MTDTYTPAADAAPPAGEKKNEKESFSLIGVAFDAVSIVTGSALILALIFTFCFRLVEVRGDSMLDTLKTGDWLVVTPYYWNDPQYGDIVISTKETAAEGSLVKRVIGTEGDEVNIDAADNVFVNGAQINDSYARKDGIPRGDRTYPVTVPDDCVMLMGDNRVVSWDSRYTAIGFAEREYLLGKAVARLSLQDWNVYANFPED